jgi:ribonuclease BN (tRNA processing enzyme)
MEVTFLGTGSPMAPERCATGLLVTASGCEPLLIDTCGGFELPRQLARIGQPIGGLRNVIVTHKHMDHMGGMPALFIATIPLTIYASADTHAGIRDFMHACFPEWPIHPEVSRITIAAGERHAIGGFSVSFFAVEHRVPTVAVRVEHDGQVFAFSADGVPTEGMIACARDADLFACDALCSLKDGAAWAERARALMHPVAREAAEMAVAAGAKALALTHLARYANAENLHTEAQEIFPGLVTVPDDCTTLRV